MYKNEIICLLIILLLGSTANLNAQNFSTEKQKQIDSLNLVINNPESSDTSIVSAYVGLSEILYVSNIDTLRYLCEIAKTLSENAIKETNKEVEILSLKNSLATALNNIGVVYYYKGQVGKCLEYYHKSLNIQKEIGDKKGVANSLNNIGVVYMNTGQVEKCLHYYHESLKIKKEIGNKKGVATSLNNIGVIYMNTGEIEKGLDYYHKSLKIQKEIGDNRGLAINLLNIGVIYKSQGQMERGLEYFLESLLYLEDVGDKTALATCLNNVGYIYEYQKQFEKSLEYYYNSLAIRKEIEDKAGVSQSLNNIGSIFKSQGETEKSLEYFNKSLKIREEIGYKSEIANSLNNISKVYHTQGNYKLCLKNSIAAYELASEIGEDLEIKNSTRTLYKTYLLTDSLTNAVKHLSVLLKRRNQNLQTNFFTLPEKEKQTYFATMESDYGLYYDFALNFQSKFKNVTDTSYNIALQNKGLTLKSSTAMRQAIQNSGDTTLIKEYKNWLSLKKKIANTNETDSTYKDLIVKANDIERDLVKISNIFSDFDKVRKLKWQDVQSGLKENEAAIEFVHFRSEVDTTNPIVYAALIIKKDSKSPEMVKLCQETDLKDILGSFQGNNQIFVNSVYGNKEQTQTALYENVWKPMEKNLEGVENIYLSPSGLLHKVAFNAIAKDKNTYLCDTYNIRQQNSTGKVALPNDIAFTNDQEFLMMGGVQYDTDTSFNQVWNYLPGTLEETNNIKFFLEEKQFQVTHLTSNDAREDVFKTKAPEANILHVATHGFFFPDPEEVRKELEANTEYFDDIVFRGNNINPNKMKRSTRYADWTFVKNQNPLMRSGITLANANDVWQRPALSEGEDGILTAQEVSTLNLTSTNLVVLSACETGLGDIKGSEGVYGLQRAFKMAGAKHLIMSLWQVPDKETSEFMQLFYKNLVKTKDTPKAFDQTQQVMRKKYDPYYWAAFVLVE